jgi:hypothetical protein
MEGKKCAAGCAAEWIFDWAAINTTNPLLLPPSNRCFMVHDRKAFVERVLPR